MDDWPIIHKTPSQEKEPSRATPKKSAIDRNRGEFNNGRVNGLIFAP